MGIFIFFLLSYNLENAELLIKYITFLWPS